MGGGRHNVHVNAREEFQAWISCVSIRTVLGLGTSLERLRVFRMSLGVKYK